MDRKILVPSRRDVDGGTVTPGGTFYSSSSFRERTTFYDDVDPEDERHQHLFIAESPRKRRKSSSLSTQFDVELQRTSRPFLIGITGGSASGKTTVCKQIIEFGGLQSSRVAVISQDSFYRPLNPRERKKALAADFNFDHPSAFDNDMMLRLLVDLQEGRPIDVPVYNFVTHSREDRCDHVDPVEFVLVEGIMIFSSRELRELFDLRVFIDTDDDVRLIRRIRRDINERGRALENVLTQYERFVKPAYENFILPGKRYADIVLPRGGANRIAVRLIVDHIQYRLLRAERGGEQRRG